MATKEKAHLSGGPIPNCVLADIAELKHPCSILQASRLVRLYAVNASMAETLAPLVFLEVLR